MATAQSRTDSGSPHEVVAKGREVQLAANSYIGAEGKLGGWKMPIVTSTDTADAFIARWQKSSGAERANFQMFAIELCGVLGVTPPEPSRGEDAELNDYCFERSVHFKGTDGTTSPGRIDLYKRSAFVMEAKQSREKGRPKEIKLAGQPDLLVPNYSPRGERSANRAWDQLMISARHQAQEYARALPVEHGWPPFVLVCDVGHCIEVYADFSGQGKNYAQFPDRQGFRIYLSDLREEAVRRWLKLLWENPTALDPARQSAKVTREIAARLAEVSKGLEGRGHNAEDVALFLMRCLFTMFAEDVGLLPKESFKELLAKCASEPKKFAPMVEQLWKAMDKGDFAFAIEQTVKRFNGKLFKEAKALDLRREEIYELAAAAKYNWREVEPAIFGTLLEQALNERERARLGAHYTPRAYVERLVVVTVIEPLRQEWAQVQATAERLKAEGRAKDSVGVVRSFHEKLCATRVLDPACGTGNFLYVSMELMKRLEGEVLEALIDLGGQEALALDRQAVDPHQFLGLELNPRAAAIAELVIWLGYLQWHYRTRGGTPSEPILRDFRNIAVMDSVLTWDGFPIPKAETKDGKRVEIYPNARRPEWPEAEFIVGNPPFVAGQDFRRQFGDGYAEALWLTYEPISGGADLVMYWWDRAAELVEKAGTKLQRFGLVTTNSITQEFNRRVVERHLRARRPLSIVMAIPDHPWTKAVRGSAAVRIAMTVVVDGRHSGVLREVVSEAELDSDQPSIELSARIGTINPNLTIGTDVTQAQPLRANEGICSDGVKLHGKGFIVKPKETEALGVGKRPGLEQYVRPYRNGSDLSKRAPRGLFVIDLFGLDADTVRSNYPEVYQHVAIEVRDKIVTDKRTGEEKRVGRAWNNRPTYRANWWLFGEPRGEIRPALVGLRRYVGTVDTAEHRVFQFISSDIVCDDGVVLVASDDAFTLGILQSSLHFCWALSTGGWLGAGNDLRWNKTKVFDPFPFPECSDDLKARIRTVAEELDAHRKARQADHPRLTITQMYNVLEKLKAGEPLDEDDERIKNDGLILILKELHEKLDALVFEAYGWPATLIDEDILARLVALNLKRALEEKVGIVKWLRPDYQVPRLGSEAERAHLAAEKQKTRQDQLALMDEEDDEEAPAKPKFQTGNELAETADVMRVLATASEPLSVGQIARTFAQGKAIEKRVALIILALARLGHLSSSDGGGTFVLRRVA